MGVSSKAHEVSVHPGVITPRVYRSRLSLVGRALSGGPSRGRLGEVHLAGREVPSSGRIAVL